MRQRQIILLLVGGLLMATVGLLVARQPVKKLIKEQTLRGNSAVIPNKSDIVAEVINVERGDFPQALLTLQILESRDINDFYNLLTPGEIIKASPIYVYKFTGGTQQIIFTHPLNIQNIQAYYLLPKDRIRAIAKAKRGPKNTVWSITKINRSAPEFSFKPTINKSKIIGQVLGVKKGDYPQVEVRGQKR